MRVTHNFVSQTKIYAPIDLISIRAAKDWQDLGPAWILQKYNAAAATEAPCRRCGLHCGGIQVVLPAKNLPWQPCLRFGNILFKNTNTPT